MIINLLRRLLESRELHKYFLHCSTFVRYLLPLIISYSLVSFFGYKVNMMECWTGHFMSARTQAQFTLQQTIQRMNTCYNNHWQLYRNTVCQWSLGFPLRSETDPFCVQFKFLITCLFRTLIVYGIKRR